MRTSDSSPSEPRRPPGTLQGPNGRQRAAREALGRFPAEARRTSGQEVRSPAFLQTTVGRPPCLRSDAEIAQGIPDKHRSGEGCQSRTKVETPVVRVWIENENTATEHSNENAGQQQEQQSGPRWRCQITRRNNAAIPSSPSARAMTILEALNAATVNEAVRTITPSGGDRYGTRPIRTVSAANRHPKRRTREFASSLSVGVTRYVVHTSARREATASAAIR